MTHFMKLNKEPFTAIETGEKTIELRLYDEKRKKLKEGDEIVFSCRDENRQLSAIVLRLHVFDDFKDLYAALPLDKCGYKGREGSADYRDMYAYYSKEEIEKYGVVGIELANITKTEL